MGIALRFFAPPPFYFVLPVFQNIIYGIDVVEPQKQGNSREKELLYINPEGSRQLLGKDLCYFPTRLMAVLVGARKKQ